MHPVVYAAQQWLGTPFAHQASCLGQGCDCLGLVRGVWRMLHGDETFEVPLYAPRWRVWKNDARLQDGLAAQLEVVACDQVYIGAVLGFAIGQSETVNHLGIASKDTRMIHCNSRSGVIETNINEHWLRLLKAQYLFPI